MRRAGILGLIAGLLVAGATAAVAAFPPTDGQVHRVWLDGRDLDLSQPGGNDIFPDVSPDGQQVAYVRDDGSDRATQTVYVVGTDGRGRQQISSAFPASEIGYAQLVWSPDSKRLAVAVSDNAFDPYAAMSLYVLQPGAAQRRIAHAKAISSPAWSPDGRMVAFDTLREVWGVTAAGRRVWHVRGWSFLQQGRAWSATGRIAVYRKGRVAVYDERGRRRMSFPGRASAWSPQGRRIASVVSNRLEVRALSGHLVFHEVVPDLRGHNGLVWIDRTHIAIGGIGGLASDRVVRVDIKTGRISKGRLGDFGLRSPDGRFVAGVAMVENGFELRLSRSDGTDPRTLVSRPNCPDLIEGDIEWLADSGSLVYDFRCQDRF